jgi:hypothetical protein
MKLIYGENRKVRDGIGARKSLSPSEGKGLSLEGRTLLAVRSSLSEIARFWEVAGNPLKAAKVGQHKPHTRVGGDIRDAETKRYSNSQATGPDKSKYRKAATISNTGGRPKWKIGGSGQ